MSPGTFECPNCGAMVKASAKVCRECGSDDTTGWMSSEDIDYHSADIPDGYGPDNELEQDGGQAWVKLVAILLVVGLVLLFVLR